ncbi:Protein tpx2 [Rhizophlyctis rosea]|nr:Protein tpx2 [Rhizophlyctis rosea]
MALTSTTKPIVADPNNNPFAPITTIPTTTTTTTSRPTTPTAASPGGIYSATSSPSTPKAALAFPVHQVVPPLTEGKDAAYEFEAPKFHDFLQADPDTSIDKWFDFKAMAPDSDDEQEDELEEVDFFSSVVQEDASQQQQQQESEADFPVNDVSTPKASLFMQSHSVTKNNVEADDSDNESAPANTPRPIRQRSLSTFTFKLPTQQPHRTSTLDSKPRRTTQRSISNAGQMAQSRDSTGSSVVGTRPFATRSVKPLTIPKEFNFSSRLAQRDRTLGMQRPGGVQKKKGAGNKRRGLTIPKPFNLHANPKNTKKANVSRSPFVPLAVRVKTFENAVPDRFRTRPAKAARFTEMKMTHPKSPYLRTKLRTKTHSVPTTEQRILQELEKLQPFKANPVNTKIFEKPLGIPQPPPHELTIPASPAITKPRPLPPPPPSPPKIIKANPVRNLPVFEPVVEHRVILPGEVHLPGEEISEKRRREFEEMRRRKEEEEERMRRFRARPLPDDVPDPLPPAPHLPVTEPHPFRLETDIRHMFHQMTLEERLEKERAEEERAKNFKAQPLPHVEPFIPKKSERPVTDPDEVLLFTEMRADERRVFEERLKERERMEEEERERMRKKKEQREKQEIKKFRQQAVHHAQPIKHYAPVVVKPSGRKLTEPESPFIGEKRRVAMRLQRGGLREGSGVGGMVGGGEEGSGESGEE